MFVRVEFYKLGSSLFIYTRRTLEAEREPWEWPWTRFSEKHNTKKQLASKKRTKGEAAAAEGTVRVYILPCSCFCPLAAAVKLLRPWLAAVAICLPLMYSSSFGRCFSRCFKLLLADNMMWEAELVYHQSLRGVYPIDMFHGITKAMGK